MRTLIQVMAHFKKILWAIDPYDEPSRLASSALALKYLVDTRHSTIQPIYVIPVVEVLGDEGDGAGNIEEVLSRDRAADQALDEKALSDRLKEVQLQNLLPPRVIRATSDHHHQVAGALLTFGKSIGADVILVNTHGWAGFARAFRVSFANRLLLRSTIPILILGPRVVEIAPFDRILYATHMDSESKQDFRYAVDIAQDFHSELTVLHLLSRRERDLDGDNATAVGESLPPGSTLMRRARAWSNWASRRGVSTEILVSDEIERISEGVLRAAEKRRVGMILLESRSGSFLSALKGSRAQEVIREALCPVWVLRTSKKTAADVDYEIQGVA